jgi:putative membrane protein
MMPMMSGSGGAAMWILLLLWALAVGVGVFALALALARPGTTPGSAQTGTMSPRARPAEPSHPEETLRMRYARGEIDTDEFQRRMAGLRGHS